MGNLYNKSKLPNTCNGCVAPKRYPGCHDHCEEYIKARKEFDDHKNQVYENAKKDFVYGSYKRANIKKTMKRIGKR